VTLIWTADYTLGGNWSTVGFGNCQYQTDTGSIVNSYTGVAIDGEAHALLGNALRFTCAPGDRRIEVTPPDALNEFGEGDDIYFRFDFVLDSNFEVSTGNYFHCIAQIHHFESSGSPPLEFDVNTGGLYTRGYDGTTHNIFRHRLFDVSIGVKHSVVVRVKFSFTAANNLVEVWLDGTQVFSQVPGHTMLRGGVSYLKFGLYRDPAFTSTETLWQSNHAVATTLADVIPPPPPPPPAAVSPSNPLLIGAPFAHVL
jgi:hypothetical protein